MKIAPLRHGGLSDEHRTFGPVKAGKRPMHRRQPSPLFLTGLRPMSLVELDAGEVPAGDWGLIRHNAPWRNPRSSIEGIRTPIMVEIDPAGARYREALAPGERTHLAGGPRVRLHNSVISAGESFASGYYHSAGVGMLMLDELYQYDDVELDGVSFVERYALLRELVAEISERNHDPLSFKAYASELLTGAALATALQTPAAPGELRYLVRLDGMLDDARSRLLIANPARAAAA